MVLAAQVRPGDKVLERVQGIGGRVLQTSLDHDAEQKLQAALSGAPAPEPAPAS